MCQREKEIVWKWYLETEGIRRDGKGPRGQRRCAVFVGDFVEDYEDGGKEDSIDVSGQTKNPRKQISNDLTACMKFHQPFQIWVRSPQVLSVQTNAYNANTALEILVVDFNCVEVVFKG